MIIGVCGRMRSGKDSIAKIFCEDYGFKQLSFAKPIKEACKIMFGWTEEHVNGALKDVDDEYWGISPRLAMQLLGTEFSQNCLCEHSLSFAKKTGRSLWVKRCLADAKQGNFIISDVRFLHESRAIREAGGKIIRVTRPGCIAKSTHASETEMDEIAVDATIVNDKTLDALRENVHNVYDILRTGVLLF